MGNKANPSLPPQMRAARLLSPNEPIQLITTGVPTPGEGEVLIRVRASPVGPLDLCHLEGSDLRNKDFPCFGGVEGVGEVISSGGGFLANRLVGKKVAFFVEGGGAWAEFVCLAAKNCLEIEKDEGFESASMGFVQPLTALMFLDLAKKIDTKAVVLSSAASLVARLAAKLFAENGLRVICVVKREEQKALLVNDDPTYIVLASSEENFEEKLADAAKVAGARLAFDAVGGEFPGLLVRLLSPKSTVYVYGTLNLSNCQLDPNKLLFNGSSVLGFHFGVEYESLSGFARLRLGWSVAKLRKKEILDVKIRKRYPLDQINLAVEDYRTNMAQGKSVIIFE